MTRINLRKRVKLGRVYLTPYRLHHVEQYWKWMQDPELQRLTGSEPLTLEEEKQNQRSWRDDPNKCTFIVTDLKDKMIGDVNVFLTEDDEEEGQKVGELNVMIAEPTWRNKGAGTEAVAGMIWFAKKNLGVKKFVAKITFDNAASMNFFRNKFGFKEVSRSEAFQEATFVSQDDLDGRLETIFAASKPVEEEFPDSKIEQFRSLGNQAFAKDDFQIAIKFYDHAIEMDSSDEVLRGNRSAARLRAGEMFGALSDASVCLALSKDYAKGRHRLGNAWAAMGYADKAKEVYREATKDFPEQQKAFDEIATKTAEASIFHNPKGQLPQVVLTSIKLAPRAIPIEMQIETSIDPQPRALRFGSILYIWSKLTGEERLGVYEECVRSGYAGTAPVVPTAEALAKTKIPPFPGACDQSSISPDFVKYFESLGKEDLYERVAALVLLFEGCSLAERDMVCLLYTSPSPRD